MGIGSVLGNTRYKYTGTFLVSQNAFLTNCNRLLKDKKKQKNKNMI